MQPASPSPHRIAHLASPRPTRAVIFVLISTVLFSVVPLFIHYVAFDINPLLLNAVAHLALGGVLFAYARRMVSAYFGHDLTADDTSSSGSVAPTDVFKFMFGLGALENRSSLRRAIIRCLLGARNSQIGQNGKNSLVINEEHEPAVNVRLREKLRVSMPWLWFPMLWMSISQLTYVFFVFSSRRIETAVTTTVYGSPRFRSG